MLRGELWARGDRPDTIVLILSNDMLHTTSPYLVACTVTPADPGQHFPGIIRHEQWCILPSMVLWLPQTALAWKVGVVSDETMYAAHRFLTAVLAP